MSERSPRMGIGGLSPAQRRHMAEMHVEPGDAPMYWTTKRGSAQHRSALALAKKGLVVAVGDHSSWSFNNPGFELTEEGVRVAACLAGCPPTGDGGIPE